MSATEFPAMPQMIPRVPLRVWRLARFVVVAVTLGLCGLLVVRPEAGLKVVWGVVVPLLPLLFLVAPGLWRNLCPIAAVNQVPRVFGFTRRHTLPAWAQRYSFLVAVGGFAALVPARPYLWEENGPALAILLLATLSAAFVGGLVFKGKSGFCGTFCPLAPVQRVYGQTPFALVRNSHCEPCVGCQRNCYDFNPHVSLVADLHDDDQAFSASRKLFAGLFPGFVLAFFALPSDWSALELYGGVAVIGLSSLGLFYLADAVLPVSTTALVALFAGSAFAAYYWFVVPQALELLAGSSPGWIVWTTRSAALGLAAVWLTRTLRKERRVLEQTSALRTAPVRVGSNGAAILERTAEDGSPEVTLLPDQRRIAADPGTSLLEIIERNGLPIEAGCRMGMCGSDPITIVEGAANLSEVSAEERNTLERLGLANGARMACCALVHGPVSLSLEVEASPSSGGPAVVTGNPSVRRVVVIGNGIAGVTAADHARRNHPDCELEIIGRERHHLYNRMAISRLIYGRSGMQGLYLLPENWYDEHRVTCWLNTRAVRIDRNAQHVELATGDVLAYDRLIVTAGSSSFVPPIEGFGAPGSFVLREAEDAMQIRSYVQECTSRKAIVAGGGLLGLEAGYALHKLGVKVTVLERGAWLLRRQLDEPASQLLRYYLENLGIDIVLEGETAQINANGRVTGVTLADGSTLSCDLFLVSAGIRSNVQIGVEAGLAANQGIVVDDELRTADPQILAAGDAAEHRGRVSGLWPAAVEQGRIAGINAVGGQARYEGSVPVTMLKVTGVDVLSAGRFEPEPGDTVIVDEDQIEGRYRKLVLKDGKIAGAIMLGYPVEARGVTDAMGAGLDVAPFVPKLEAGDWSVFETAVSAVN